MRKHRGVFAVLIAGTLLLGALACEDSDKVPPADSTISLAANPATILLSNGVQDGDIQILATVYNSIGVPLPGQDVRFTMNSGVLDPQAGTPVRTNSIGNALTTLSLANTNTTVTATSGKATANIQLQTTTCNISTVDLDPTALNFTACTDSLTLTATVTDTKQVACAGVSVVFKLIDGPTPPGDEDVTINISPGTVRTDSTGEAVTHVTLGTVDCDAKCPGNDCNLSGRQITATAGATTSDAADINTSIP
ncbi:MAG TPA: hypothetical protein VFQ07_15290 [Candidatus Polarisedimenticolia bacterium]|nr:hypothetical protein [Candidatus Polarisedimenticolia bacterium]